MKRYILYGFALLLFIVTSLFFLRVDFNYKSLISYNYHFDSHATNQVGLDVSHPFYVENAKSSFLEIEVYNCFGMKPTIDVFTKNGRHTFELEPRCDGLRQLDLSSYAGTTITSIIGNELSIKKNAKVYSYLPAINDKDRILIVSPHPDDAEIAAYGVYKKYKDITTIVTVTAGDSGSDYNCYRCNEPSSSYLKYIEKANRRYWESLTVPLFAGIQPSQILNLGYYDGTLMKMATNNNHIVFPVKIDPQSAVPSFREIGAFALEKNTEKKWSSLVGDFIKILTKLRPSVIITPHPFLYKHNDHRYATMALIEALGGAKLGSIKLLMYTNHSTLSERFPMGETFSPMYLPPHIDYNNKINLYSNTLNLSEMREKSFVLESMSALRDEEKPSGFLNLLKRKAGEVIKNNDQSYFRRAVRSSEIFFVYDSDIFLKRTECLKYFNNNEISVCH